MSINRYQAKYFAHELKRSYANDDVGKLARLLFVAPVESKSLQFDVALFAIQTLFLRGGIMVEEVARGKIIEVGIVITKC